MTKAEAIEMMQEELSTRGSNNSYTESYLLKKLNSAQRAAAIRISNLNPNLLSGPADLEVTAALHHVVLPYEFLRVLSVWHVVDPDNDDSRLRKLYPMIWGAIENTVGTVGPSSVSHWSKSTYSTGTAIAVWPPNSQTMTIRVHAIAVPPELEDDTDEIFNGLHTWTHDYVVMKALRQAVGRGRNTSDIQWILNAEKEAWDDIVMNIPPAGLEPMMDATGYIV